MKVCKECNAELPDDHEIKRCEECEIKHMEKSDKRLNKVMSVVTEVLNQL